MRWVDPLQLATFQLAVPGPTEFRWDPPGPSVRVRKMFLLFPMEIYGETRWLEWVKVRQIRTYDEADWWSVEFIDD